MSNFATTPKHMISALDYERVEASATDQAIGTTGGAGDVLVGVFVETNTGTIVIKDNTTTVLTLPASITENYYPLNIKSKNGAWKVTTAASTSCLCVGYFS